MTEPIIIGPKCKTEIKFAESLAAPLLEATQAYLIKTGKERNSASVRYAKRANSQLGTLEECFPAEQ